MINKKKKVCVFTGTRADYGLLYWLMREIKNSDMLELQIITSGTHLSPEFGMTVNQIEIDGFKINEKIDILLSSCSDSGVAKSIGLGIISFADAIKRLKPDIIVVLGDRTEALAITQTAMVLRVPILHIHGGEITEGAIDDYIRNAITKMSFLHCTASEEYSKRVVQMGEEPARVFNVGAVGLDHLNKTAFYSKEELSNILNFNLKKDYFIVTYHPATLGDEDPSLSIQTLLSSLEKFKEFNTIITYPNADHGGRLIIPFLVDYANSHKNRVLLLKSLGQKNYLNALKLSKLVIGNSSSGIIEAPSLQVPTINVGIRQKGRLSAKSVIDVKLSESSIISGIKKGLKKEFYANKDNFENPYGSPGASRKILNILEDHNMSGQKNFYDIDY